MKESTQQLLLLLSSSEQPIRSGILRAVFFPRLSESGYRSMMNLLTERGHVLSSSKDSGVALGLTESGQQALTASFPALQRLTQLTEPEWRMVVFLQPPKADPSFRYLRRICQKAKLLMLSRGVYAQAGALPSDLEKLLIKLYAQAVAVVRVSEWEIGAKKPIINQRAECQLLSNSYSGISNELKSLLQQIDHQKTLISAQKLLIGDIFSRYYHSLCMDTGVCDWVYPEFVRCDVPLKLIGEFCQRAML